jgi:hypothetical protein
MTVVPQSSHFSLMGRYRWADTSPTLTDCLWFMQWLFVGTQRTPNWTRRMVLSHWRVDAFLDLASLVPATLSVWRVHRLVRGCRTTPPRILLRRCWIMRGSVGGDRNAWSGRWRRRWWWNTWRRKEVETYGRGCPAGVSQDVETMVPGTCPSNRWAMFDVRSFRSSSPVSCDAGFRGVWSRCHLRLRLRGSHPWVRMGVPYPSSGRSECATRAVGWCCEGTRRGANPCRWETDACLGYRWWRAAGSCSDVGRRCWRQFCQLFSMMKVQGYEQRCVRLPYRRLYIGCRRSFVVVVVITSIRTLRIVQITSSSPIWRRYWWADTAPTLTDCLWFMHWLFVETQQTPNCTRRMLLSHWRVASFLDLVSLEPATLSVWRVHRLVRGRHTLFPRLKIKLKKPSFWHTEVTESGGAEHPHRTLLPGCI